MLLRFGVSNYRSISDYQELLLSASAIKKHQLYVISVNGLNSKILPAIGIYGANAFEITRQWFCYGWYCSNTFST